MRYVVFWLGVTEEVYFEERFRGNCSEMSVVIIISARYGRMRLGNCIRTLFSDNPCFIDVLAYVDKLCGGQRACVILVPNRDLDMMPSPCSEDLKQFLEISYHYQEGKNASSAYLFCIILSHIFINQSLK